jgi:hypothetical protein
VKKNGTKQQLDREITFAAKFRTLPPHARAGLLAWLRHTRQAAAHRQGGPPRHTAAPARPHESRLEHRREEREWWIVLPTGGKRRL